MAKPSLLFNFTDILNLGDGSFAHATFQGDRTARGGLRVVLLYADEGFPKVVTGLLRQFGHDVLRKVDEVKRDRP